MDADSSSVLEELSHKELADKLSSLLSCLSCDTIENMDFEALRCKRRAQIIELLHEFNEFKDASQTILGVLANAQSTTIRELHENYDLPLED